MKCEMCGKEKNCQTWDYIVKKELYGSVRQYTPGTNIEYRVGGRVTGVEKDTTYGKGYLNKIAGKGTAGLCIKCRIIWSIILIIALTLIVTLGAFIFLKGIETLFKVEPKGNIVEVLLKTLEVSLFMFAILSITPLMKHIILSLKISRRYKVAPWKVMSKFWE